MSDSPTPRRVLVVLGASSGIGLAVARQAAAQGDHVVLAARGPSALERARESCAAAGAASVLVRPTDVTNAEAVRALFDAVQEAYGRVDAVVYAAGVVAYGRFEEVPREVWEGVITTNLFGLANVARVLLPRFRERNAGHLVVIGSVLGQIAPPFMTSYAVSKWGLHGLVRMLQIENRDRPGVHIGNVSPGGVDTPIYRQAGSYLGRVGRPPPPVATPERVAAVILRMLDHPRPRAQVGPFNPLMVLGFQLLPRVFDAIVTPLFEVAATDVRESAPPHSGNVLTSTEDGNRLRGEQGSVVASIAAGVRAKLSGRL